MIRFKTRIGSRNRIQIPYNEIEFSDLKEGDVVEVIIEKANPTKEESPVSIES